MSNVSRKAGRKRKGAFREKTEFLLYRAITGMVDRVSDQSARTGGERLGALAARLLPRRHQLVLRNLAATFPDKSVEQREGIALACWKHFGRMTLDYVRKRNWPLERVIDQVDLEGWSNLENALAMQRGVIVVTAHLGDWEIGLNVLSRAGVRVTTVARALDNQLLEEELYRVRRRSGIELVDRRHAARTLVRAIEKKEIVVLLPDQAVQPGEGILALFLGRPAWTTPAPARLALRYQVPIVVLFCIPGEERSTLRVLRPILCHELPVDARTAEGVTALINDHISAAIREKPELWLWMHNRWKWTS